MFQRQLKIVLISIFSLLVLSGCPGLVFLGGTAAIDIAADNRTLGANIDDKKIQLKGSFRISEKLGKSVHINVNSFNANVLLTGEVPSEELRQQMIDIIRSIEGVNQIYDRTEISGPSSLTSRTADLALEARAKTALCGVQSEDFSCLTVEIVVERGVVYMLGLVTEEHAKLSVEKVRNLDGVIRVVQVFEYL